jgi:tetratricopeptide (TPR) repeat protein
MTNETLVPSRGKQAQRRRKAAGIGVNAIYHIQNVLTFAAIFVIGAGSVSAAPAAAKKRSGTQRAVRTPQAEAILDDIVGRIWDRADWYWHEGRYEERVALDRLVIRMEPRFIDPYGTAGWLLESLGRDAEALELYRQAVTVAPERWETHHDLGMYHYQHKDYPAAAAAFRRATQCAEPPAYVWKMLAHAYERSGRLDQAVATWEAAARVAPDDPAVEVNLRRVQARLRQRDDG